MTVSHTYYRERDIYSNKTVPHKRLGSKLTWSFCPIVLEIGDKSRAAGLMLLQEVTDLATGQVGRMPCTWEVETHQIVEVLPQLFSMCPHSDLLLHVCRPCLLYVECAEQNSNTGPYLPAQTVEYLSKLLQPIPNRCSTVWEDLGHQIRKATQKGELLSRGQEQQWAWKEAECIALYHYT